MSLPDLAPTSPYSQAAISAASSGDNTLVAAVAGKSIRVYRIVFTLAAGSVAFKDGASTSLTGAMTATAGVLEDPIGNPLFITTAGNAFIANLSGANQLSGVIYYVTA